MVFVISRVWQQPVVIDEEGVRHLIAKRSPFLHIYWAIKARAASAPSAFYVLIENFLGRLLQISFPIDDY